MKRAVPGVLENVSFERYHEDALGCPNCGARGLWTFYAAADIPVHSCLLMAGRAEALQYPRGNLSLGVCLACGFICNTRFDSDVHEYSTRYEETQGFSDCFNAFARSLAKRLIERHDLHGKSILEIGCGKGEFLSLLCELGGNRGVGIDPAYVPERMPGRADQVRFIQDFYGPKYADVRADFICCRHTLEHIAPTGEFLRGVRKAVGDRTDTLIFFEVPETLRVLQEGAFWDLYYEHCSYFTAGSLARLFRASGFDVLDVSADYADQYLLLTARPSPGAAAAGPEIEGDLDELTRAVEAFGAVCSDRMTRWRGRIAEIAAAGRRVVIWGSGSKGVAFLTTLGLGDPIEYVVDINPYKHGKYMPGTGQEIVSPEFLTEYRPEHVIVMNPVYCREIQRDLDRLGLAAELMPV